MQPEQRPVKQKGNLAARPLTVCGRGTELPGVKAGKAAVYEHRCVRWSVDVW